MAKIEGSNLLAGILAGYQARKTEKKPESKKTGRFSSILKDIENEQTDSGLGLEAFSDAAISELMDNVHSAGEDLKKEQNIDNVQAYKKAVRNFVHYVVERAYTVEEHTSGRNILKRKKFTSIAIIDEKLEKLAAEVMSSQRDRLDILKRMEEIQGLLVDLLS